VLIGEPDRAVRFSEYLREEGVYTPAVRPPSVPPGKSRIRASLMASHSMEQIEYALRAFRTVSSKFN